MATEKRMIDANALKSKLQEHHDYFVDGWGGFDKMSFATKCRVDEIDNCIAEIVNAITVDAVKVVRCKDCFANGCCSVQDALEMGDEGYCPKGRKEN